MKDLHVDSKEEEEVRTISLKDEADHTEHKKTSKLEERPLIASEKPTGHMFMGIRTRMN